MTNAEVLEVAAKYGLSNEVTGYPDFETQLLRFLTEIVYLDRAETKRVEQQCRVLLQYSYGGVH